MSESTLLPATVLDRELVFHDPTAIQLALMQRLIKVTQVASDAAKAKDIPKDRQTAAYNAMLDAFAKLLDIIGSLLPEEDSQWLSEQMLFGRVDDEGLLKILNDILPEEEEAKPKANPKRVRRG